MTDCRFSSMITGANMTGFWKVQMICFIRFDFFFSLHMGLWNSIECIECMDEVYFMMQAFVWLISKRCENMSMMKKQPPLWWISAGGWFCFILNISDAVWCLQFKNYCPYWMKKKEKSFPFNLKCERPCSVISLILSYINIALQGPN